MLSMRSVLRALRPGRAGSTLAYGLLAGGLALTITAALPACSNADEGADLNPESARSLEVAQAGNNPCAGANPCNPCAGKNPCAGNPCNPCAGKNPCAGANPCNPCGAGMNPCAGNPCNPCAMGNPCNPCGGMNPCNPCGGMNPCNPCGGGAMVDPDEFVKPAGMSMGGGDRAALVAQGEELWNDTSLSTNGASCNTCHVAGAQFQKSFSKPYPHKVAMVKQMSGVKEVDAAEMVQFCMLQPMQAEPLPWGSQELAALTAYTENMQQQYLGNPCSLQGSAGGNPCNPCAMGNPCNPCAGMGANPCNPCGAGMNPCNPCAMKNPCNPCGGMNPCNPCGGR